jgi:hypothetical protein
MTKPKKVDHVLEAILALPYSAQSAGSIHATLAQSAQLGRLADALEDLVALERARLEFEHGQRRNGA